MQGQEQKGASVCLVTLHKVARGVVLHVVSYCIVVFSHAALRMAGCCTRVAAAHAALCVVGYYMTVTACIISHTKLGMLSQFGCCIQDAATGAIAASLKFPEAKSTGLVDLLLLFSFPRWKLKRVFCSVWVVLNNPNKCCKRAFSHQLAVLWLNFWKMRHLP